MNYVTHPTLKTQPHYQAITMESQLPECPICLQTYDTSDTVPRVLACGHTTCESCLKELPHPYPQTIRCPACTQLVKYPPNGPTSLPKNIDLLRLCNTTTNINSSDQKRPNKDSVSKVEKSASFVPGLWSDEFYVAWKDWVLPKDCILIEKRGGDDCDSGSVICGKFVSLESVSGQVKLCLRDNNLRVCLVSVGSLTSTFGFGGRLGYIATVMKSLSGMDKGMINELGLVLRVASQVHRLCRVYGVWGDIENGILYLVCERHERMLSGSCGILGDGFVSVDCEDMKKDSISSFALLGLEMCEAVIGFHREGLIVGCLNLWSVYFSGFESLCVDLSEVLVTGRKLFENVQKSVSGSRKIGNNELQMILHEVMMKSGMAVSPEVILQILEEEDNVIDATSNMRYGVCCRSDVWTLGCMLIKLLVGRKMLEEVWKLTEGENLDFSAFYEDWLKKVSSLLIARLGSEFSSFEEILSQCLNLDPDCRPHLHDIQKCIRGLITKHHFQDVGSKAEVTHQDADIYCVCLGKLCQMSKRMSDMEIKQLEHDVVDEGQSGKVVVEKDFVDGVSRDNIICKELWGHLDCVTALAVGGGCLLSSSFDKTVQVWSLQDFTHVHSFKGHEHKIMALVFVDENEPLCVSGDSGGGIFIWNISQLGQEPVKKWYEQQDWRYSGIHSLAYSTSGYLYTGSGDKLIKAWSLQDCTLLCSMSGHTSVVSSLVVSNEVLYSGSWDGTVRLWCLGDHSPLAVLGEGVPGRVIAVLPATADRNFLIAACENGSLKVWKNDVYIKSVQIHTGAVFAVTIEGKWFISGGWDKTVNIQELAGDDFHVEVRPGGSITCGSVVTVLLSWEGKLYVGCADKSIKVYYCGQ